MNISSNLLLDGLPDAILQLDNFGRIIYGNAAVVTLTGFEIQDLLGKPIQYLTIHPDDHIKSTYDLGIATSQGKSLVQCWNRRYDGQKYWSETAIVPLTQNPGEQTGFGCIIRNLSKQKEEEMALQENEERFRLLVEGVLDYSIYMLDTEGRIITWNEGGLQLTGYTTSEIVGKHFSIFYSSHDLLNNKPSIELETARNKGKYEEEGWRVRKNGSVFWASVVLTALHNDENKLIGFSKVTKDLTEQKNEQLALRQSEERYRLLVEQVTDYAIFMMDEKGRIVSWNEGAKRIKGYDPSEVIGKYFSIFYPEEEIFNGKPAYELKEVRKNGKYEEEGWRIRKDGSKFWANVIITAVYNADKILVGFSKVTRDLTERKIAEQTDKENSEKYRKIAQEMETINIQLSQTNYDLEQFTSIVAHDLQEPLRTVKSFLHLINDRIAKGSFEDIDVYVGKCSLAANRMRELIDNVLSYSQVSKGQISTVQWPLDEILENTMQNLKGSLDASGARILFDKSDNDTITGDKVQLTQLFQNLVSNAIKFTDGKQPVITITHSSDNGHSHFAISDNGIGMDADSTSKIFDPFRRLHAARNYPGAGMGLAICKKVVERHQGRIWVESQPDSGSTFHFTLWETGAKPFTSNEKV
jgi:PAS domain S-box-containing protein